MGEVIEYHGFENCFQNCQKPIRMFLMMLKQNMLSVGRNQKACLDQCKTLKDADLYECNTVCVKESTEALSLLDKHLSDEVVRQEEHIFASTKV